MRATIYVVNVGYTVLTVSRAGAEQMRTTRVDSDKIIITVATASITSNIKLISDFPSAKLNWWSFRAIKIYTLGLF